MIYICYEMHLKFLNCKYFLTLKFKMRLMNTARTRKFSRVIPGPVVSKITNLLFMVVCVLMLFSFSWIIFDKGAVMVAEKIIGLNSPPF